MNVSSSRRPGLPLLGLALVAAAALTVRLLRLEWQPLWWDEGYSVYFGAEPLGRMLALTAGDIHPPFYYALLHSWIGLFGPSPLSVRLLSVVIGAVAVGIMFWLGRAFYPNARSVAWIAALLLIVSPMHIYYSQEVRMYGLAMVWGMLSSGLLWQATRSSQAGERAWGSWTGYVLASAAALYTLYYAALLLAAQAAWALWNMRRERRGLHPLLLSWAAVLLLYLPWLAYALPRLIDYVAQKVVADQDAPLQPLPYLARHLRAFLVGHVAPEEMRTTWTLVVALLGLALIAAGALVRARRSRVRAPTDPAADRALLTLLLIPAAGGYLINLRLPFFPEGGERLLLIILPYALLLVAAWIPRGGWAGVAGGAALVAASLAGVWIYYSTPRYVDEDYRPVLRQIVQQSAPGDMLLALFPWMIGYWRAYTPAWLDGPTPFLLGDQALEYGPTIEESMRTALQQTADRPGKVWFPEPLAFGSTLPAQMETWFRRNAANVENRWFGDNLRLTAWTTPPRLAWQGQQATFGPLALAGAGRSVAAGDAEPGSVLDIGLAWSAPIPDEDLAVSLRLVDADGRTWATREYAPPGQFANPDGNAVLTETVGMIVPADIPPGDYSVALAVSADQVALPVSGVDGAASGAPQFPLFDVSVRASAQPPPLARVDMTPARRQAIDAGLAWEGSTLPRAPSLAGSTVAIDLVGKSHVDTPPQRELYLNLLDEKGAAVAGWEGWPLPRYPTASWAQDAPVRVPISIDLPAAMPAGSYKVVGGWLDPLTGDKSPPSDFGEVIVVSRPLSLEMIPPGTELAPAPQFGTHALLRGYTLTRTGDVLDLELTWEVLQTLLPPHHIFVHADGAAGATLAQADGPPTSAAGPAPTGSWRPGEFIVTRHRLALPEAAAALRIGLYDPVTGTRLPVTVDGVPAGDAVTIDLATASR